MPAQLTARLGGLLATKPSSNPDVHVPQNQQYLELINAPVDLQPSYAVINARVGFGSMDDRWQVSAFVNNFTNSSALTSALDLSLFNVPTGYRVRPRTIGLTLRADF